MFGETLLRNKIKIQGLGLALGGGAARGFFHIGVLKALEEYDIPIKYIAGISIGSLIGAFFAMGYNSNEILDIMKKQTELRTLFFCVSPTLNKRGFFSGKKMISEINQLAQNRTIEQLNIPFICRAVDLIHFKEVIFDQGNIGEAVKSSCAVPGVFVPEDQDNELLVDGGILGSVPIKLLKSYYSGPILTSNLISYNNVDSEQAKKITEHFSDNILYKISPISDIVIRSFYLMQSHLYTLEFEKYSPELSVEFHGTYDPNFFTIFDTMDQLVDDGYTATIKVLKKLYS